MLCMLFDDCKANDPQIVGWKGKGQPTKLTHVLRIIYSSLYWKAFKLSLFTNNLEGMIEMEWEIWSSIKIKTNILLDLFNRADTHERLQRFVLEGIGNFGLHLWSPILLNWLHVFTFKLRWRIIHVLSSIHQLSPPEFTSTWLTMASVDPPMGY